MLTELLCEHIRMVSKTKAKLTGKWSYEDRIAVLGGSIKDRHVKERYRTDIQYFSNMAQPSLELVFEFKKVDHTRRRQEAYLGKEGMARFVSGEYSSMQPVAVMVGVLLTSKEDCVLSLQKALQKKPVREALRMRCDAQGSWLKIPSELFPDSAIFDTEHERDEEKAPEHGTIILAHVFLEFPNRGNKKALRGVLGAETC